MRSRLWMGLAVAALVVGRAGAWELKLEVKDHGGPAGLRYVTGGVPLLKGQAKEPGDLRLAVKDEAGALRPIPAQFRVLARWWRDDQSIRWVLVSFRTAIETNGTAAVYLTNAALDAPKPAPALTVDQTADAITITTGPARFVLNRKRFTFLDKAFVDADGDGAFAPEENLLATTPDCGTVIEDTSGADYFGGDATRFVEVIDSGPLRAVVRARGRHVARGGKGYSRGMYGYDVFLTFHAGSTAVFSDVVLTNNPPKSIGAPTFEDASLILKLQGPATGCRLVGGKAVDETFERAQSVCLYQDSNGAKTWAECPGFGHMKSNGWHRLKEPVTSFRGYRVYERSAPAERTTTQPADCGRVIGEGDHARGLMHLKTARGGVIVAPRHFWQRFPKAVEAAADGTVRVGLMPREFKAPHYLEDTAGTGQEIVFHFHGGTAGATTAEAVADAWDAIVMPRPPIEHIAACGALADLGPYTPPTRGLDKKPDTRTVAEGSRMLTTDRLYGNAYGWQVFGERWRSNGGHGRRGARQPIDQDNYLYRWYVTGRRDWFEAGYNRSRHFRDVRVYQVDVTQQDPFGFKTWQEFRRANRNEDWTNRPQPKDDEYKQYRQGAWARSDWPFPNPEHTTLDLLYDRYLLFGDVRCLENMRIAAAHGGYFSGRGGTRLRGGWPWRANGWGWRALFRYWDLTGDKAAEACLEDVMKTHAKHIGTTPLVSHHDVKKTRINWWFTNIYCRAVAMTALHTGDPRMLDLCKTLAAGKEKDARRVPALFAVLYHLTGDAKYRDLVLGDDDGAPLANVGGYFPACDHWLLHHPPKGK